MALRYNVYGWYNPNSNSIYATPASALQLLPTIQPTQVTNPLVPAAQTNSNNQASSIMGGIYPITMLQQGAAPVTDKVTPCPVHSVKVLNVQATNPKKSVVQNQIFKSSQFFRNKIKLIGSLLSLFASITIGFGVVNTILVYVLKTNNFVTCIQNSTLIQNQNSTDPLTIVYITQATWTPLCAFITGTICQYRLNRPGLLTTIKVFAILSLTLFGPALFAFGILNLTLTIQNCISSGNINIIMSIIPIVILFFGLIIGITLIILVYFLFKDIYEIDKTGAKIPVPNKDTSQVISMTSDISTPQGSSLPNQVTIQNQPSSYYQPIPLLNFNPFSNAYPPRPPPQPRMLSIPNNNGYNFNPYAPYMYRGFAGRRPAYRNYQYPGF